MRAEGQNDSWFDGLKIGVFSFCYHFSGLFDDDFVVLLVGGTGAAEAASGFFLFWNDSVG